jgi:hypothetical protein
MTMPKWNNDWDQSDPLRGKRGWNVRRYIVVGITLMLFVTFCGLLVRNAAWQYQRSMIEYEKYKLQRDAIDIKANESHRK